MIFFGVYVKALSPVIEGWICLGWYSYYLAKASVGDSDAWVCNKEL